MVERSHEWHGDASNAPLHGRLDLSPRSELQVFRVTAAESADGHAIVIFISVEVDLTAQWRPRLDHRTISACVIMKHKPLISKPAGV
jgi:hypothetical protein